MRGRKPKPTALKRLQGTPGKRPLNDKEPDVSNKKPRCPSWLSPSAKVEWRRIAGVLHEAGLLTYVDRAALAGYCQAYGRWKDAEEQLETAPLMLETDKGYCYPNPLIGIARGAFEDMSKMAAEFGMTPSARSRLKVEKPEKEKSLADTLFELIN